MSGRPATTDRRPGRYALSVGLTEMPAPPGWCWIELQQAARLESGHTPSRKFPSYWDGGIPWIGIKDARIHHGKKIFETLQTVSQEGLDNSAARLLPAGTVCLSRTASVGYSLVMGESMATSQDFVNWICSDVVDPEFLMHLFIAEEESLLRFGKGTTHTTIYYPEVKAFHVCLPPKREQRRILEAIESYFTRLDDAVATLERVQRNLRRYRASVLKAAVEGRLVPTEAELARAEGRDYEPASVLLERILVERRRRWEEAELAKMQAKGKAPNGDRWKAKYKEPIGPEAGGLPELPEGWCWASVDQLGEVSGGITQNAKREQLPVQVPFLRVANVYANELRLDDVKTIGVSEPELNRALLASGDLLVVEGNGSIDQIGRVALWDGSIAPCLHQNHIIKVRLFLDGLPKWTLSWLLAPLGRIAIERAASSTSGLHTLSLSKVGRLPVPLAPATEQVRVADEVDRLTTLALAAEQAVTANALRCSRLRQSILKWAFEGRLVDQDPTDEPASRLLERIQAEQESTNGHPRRTPRRTRAKSPKA